MMNNRSFILVFGATGQQGGSVARALINKGWPVRVMVRNPSSPASLALRDAGAEMVAGNFDDIEAMRGAMTGAYGVFSVQPSSPGGTVTDDDEVRYGKTIASLASECGVQHLVCRKNSRKLSGPDMIVVHYTAGTSARTAAEFLAKEEVKASAHLVIGRQGELFQLVPFDTEAWHAGRSSYDGRANLNRYSIGIELDNLGRLQLQEGRFVAECGVEVAPADVYVDDTGEAATFWHRYTDRQKRMLGEICRLLKQHYPIRYVVGHSDITDRKQDPGPELHGFMCK